MTRFNYVARARNGESVVGTLTAPSPAAASQQLRQEGKFPVRLVRASASARPGAPEPSAPESPAQAGAASDVRMSNRGIRHPDIIFLTTQLAVMTETGVPLSESLISIADQTSSVKLRNVLLGVCDRVKSGEEFSAALARHPKVFSAMYVAMVKAAEASGTLGMMLSRVAGYLTDEYETCKRVKGALTYPLAMLVFAVGVTAFLMTGVLPRFSAIYAGKQALLPMPTRVVLGVSGFLVHYWIYLVVGLVVAVAGLVLCIRTERGQDWWAGFKLKVPLIGGMLHQFYLARAIRTLGTLIGAGVSMLDAVELVQHLSRRGPFGRLWALVDKAMREGRQLSDPLFRDGLIPRSVAQMIAAGEKSGQLPKVMERVADFTDQELKNQIKVSTAMIEPVMIVVMGLIIGSVTLALLLPIFTISKVMTGAGPH